MKATELRIGNWVSLGQVIRIDRYTASIKSKRGTHTNKYDFINPIPLTEEWLERFGFEDGCLRVDTEDGSLLLVLGAAKEVQIYHKDEWLGRRVYYVHSLQNLYFALTGLELEVSSD